MRTRSGWLLAVLLLPVESGAQDGAGADGQAQTALERPNPYARPPPVKPRLRELEAIRVEFRAHTGCAPAAVFLADVLSRARWAKAAAPHELARVFRVSVDMRRGESVGEISVQREAGTPVRLSAVGRCDQVLNTLAQFAAISLDPDALFASAQGDPLPDNPYRNWKGPLAEPIPDNPYRRWTRLTADALPHHPYRAQVPVPARQAPEAPFVSEPRLPSNPYRR